MRRKWTTTLTTLALTAMSAAPVFAAAAADGGHSEPELIAPPAAGLIPAVTTLIIFCLLLAILGKYAWGPIASGLKAREEKIRRDIADAEAARARAEETLRQYNAQLAAAEERVRELLGKATADGERLATNIRMKAQQESEEIKERANRDIEASRDAAVRQVREEAVSVAIAAAEKILRRNLNPDDQRDLVRGSLDQLETISK